MKMFLGLVVLLMSTQGFANGTLKFYGVKPIVGKRIVVGTGLGYFGWKKWGAYARKAPAKPSDPVPTPPRGGNSPYDPPVEVEPPQDEASLPSYGEGGFAVEVMFEGQKGVARCERMAALEENRLVENSSVRAEQYLITIGDDFFSAYGSCGKEQVILQCSFVYDLENCESSVVSQPLF